MGEVYTLVYASLPTVGEVHPGIYASLPTMGEVHHPGIYTSHPPWERYTTRVYVSLTTRFTVGLGYASLTTRFTVGFVGERAPRGALGLSGCAAWPLPPVLP